MSRVTVTIDHKKKVHYAPEPGQAFLDGGTPYIRVGSNQTDCFCAVNLVTFEIHSFENRSGYQTVEGEIKLA